MVSNTLMHIQGAKRYCEEVKRRGPRTEPWGTPKLRFPESERMPLTDTEQSVVLEVALNHFSATLVMSYQCLRINDVKI